MTNMTDSDAAIGLQKALEMTLGHVRPLSAVRVPLSEGLNRVLTTDIRARVDSPSMDASLMDGYAVRSADLSGASKERPVGLLQTGIAAAGSRPGLVVEPQHTVRVLTGAPIPSSADAVVPEEFTIQRDGLILFYEGVEPGRNILSGGSDVTIGQVVAKEGCLLTPGILGMLAAAGHSHVDVVRPPEVAIIGTGDEVVAPGEPLPEGKLYASNITTLDGWCRRYGFRTRLCVVGDDPAEMFQTMKQFIDQVDAVVTSGGAWSGDRDMVAQTLQRLGWKQVFHRIRMAPGKGVGFGLLDQKPIFMLPGGPPANLMGFLQIALPGLLRLAGHNHTGLPEMSVRPASDLKGRHIDWTQFVFGTLERQNDRHVFHPLLTRSRLQSMAEAEAIVAIPEGESRMATGAFVRAQILIEKTSFMF